MSMDEIFTFENLYASHKQCRCSKQHKGEVIRFEINLAQSIYALVNEINSGKYKLGKYKTFKIYDPKERTIEALPYKDRVVINCFCKNCLSEKIEKKLIYDNAACRIGKGSSFGIKRLHLFLRREFCRIKTNKFYFLKCDIRKYFQSINHEVLFNSLKKCDFTDEELNFMKIYIDNTGGVGLPLGNQTSQWFALLYLNRLDRFIKEKLRIKNYIRYMDDMILVHEDKAYLQYCRTKIEKLCNSELLLSLNQKTQIGKVANGIDFLGFRHIVTPSGKIIRKLRQSSKIRLKRHLKVMDKLFKRKIIDDEYINIRKATFKAHMKGCSESWELKKKLK